MRKIEVNASKRYTVSIGEDISAAFSFPFRESCEKVLIVTDKNVAELYCDLIRRADMGKEVFTYVLSAGENAKSAENYIAILNFMADKGFQRNDAVISFGGGVIGDLAAFCASTYMRGVSLYAVPTTILAAVDSSVGGKTAINLDRGKNLCGTFYQPDAVNICTDFFKTLPDRERACGLGEVIKYAFLSDTVTEKDITGGNAVDLVYNCVAIKKDIVERDEREQGDRKLLNLGHTVGHAIERKSGFSLSHGECVVKGIYAALKISKKLCALSDEEFYAAEKILTCFGHDLTIPYSADEIISEIKCDKKAVGNFVDFVLIGKDLKAVIERISMEDIKAAL